MYRSGLVNTLITHANTTLYRNFAHESMIKNILKSRILQNCINVKYCPDGLSSHRQHKYKVHLSVYSTWDILYKCRVKYDALDHLVDLAADDDVLRKVRKSDGLRLSTEFETLFDEVS